MSIKKVLKEGEENKSKSYTCFYPVIEYLYIYLERTFYDQSK